jgi:hypothetical protein
MQNAYHTKVAIVQLPEENKMALAAAKIGFAVDVSGNRKLLRELSPYRPVVTQRCK